MLVPSIGMVSGVWKTELVPSIGMVSGVWKTVLLPSVGTVSRGLGKQCLYRRLVW